jgi:hypothetical protein
MISRRNLIFLYSMIAGILSLHAQSDSLIAHKASDEGMLIGKCTRIELQNGDFGNYFFNEYRNYEPERELLRQIENKIFGCNITIVLGTWCHDSHEQVPRFIKILDMIDYNTNKLKLICVDRNKEAGDIDISALHITRVPTFILYKRDKELGRIIETPAKSLEFDMNLLLRR